MKRFAAITIAAIAMFMQSPQQAEAQHFHRGFGGPGWGGSGFSISVGQRFGPSFGPGFNHGWNRGFQPGFVNPGFYRPVPVNAFYRGGFGPGFHGGFNRGVGIQYGRGHRPGCGW